MSQLIKANLFGTFNKRLFFIAITLIITSSSLVGCGRTGGDDGHSYDTTSPSTISGVAAKGLMGFASIRSTTLAGITLSESITAADGSYILAKTDHQGPTVVELTTNASTRMVCDAAAGCGMKNGVAVGFGDSYMFDDPDFKMTSVLPQPINALNQRLMVTPFTHLATQRSMQQGLTNPNQIQNTFNATAKLLGLTGIDLTSLPPTDITNPQAIIQASSEAKTYGALLGAIATMAEDNGGSVAATLKTFTDDYAADGGLVGNSTTQGKPTLSMLFKKAIDAMVAAEVHSMGQNTPISFGAEATKLTVAKNTADKKSPDTEVVPVVPIDPSNPTDAEKLALMLEDIVLWDNALNDASDKHLYQPFEDQLYATHAITDAVKQQSMLVHTIEKLVVSHSLVGDTEVIETGPLIDGIAAIASTIELVGFFERYLRLNPTAEISEYTLNSALNLGFHGKLYYANASPQDSTISVDITPTFDLNDRMTSALVDYIDTQGVGTMTESVQGHITYTLARDEGLTLPTKLTYQISDISGYFKTTFGVYDQGFFGTGGSIALTFADNQSLQSFIGYADGADPTTDLNITGYDMGFNLKYAAGAAESLANGTSSPEMVGFDVSASFHKTADLSYDAELSIDLLATNTLSNELASGTLTFDSALTATELEYPAYGAELLQEYIANSASMTYDGTINLTGDNNTSSSFEGSIGVSLSTLEPNLLGVRYLDELSMSLEGETNITDANGYTSQFSGLIDLTLASLKNEDGSAYLVGNEAWIEASACSFIGGLSTESAFGFASVDINAAIHTDLSGVMPENDYRKTTATLQVGTQLTGIEDGLVQVSAENFAMDDFKGSILFAYNPRSLRLDIDTRETNTGDAAYLTFANEDLSMRLVATCAGDTDSTHIMACDGDLNFSGDIFMNGSDEKVAVFEDRDDIQLIKFVSGESYGVVMMPNLDFVKQ